MKKTWMVLIGVLIILFALIIIVDSAKADTMYVFCNPTDFVNIRMRPDSMVIGWIECGMKVETDGKTKKYNGKLWYHVVDLAMEDSNGWICSQYLSDSPILIEEETAYCCAKERVAIRKSPNGKVKKWLYNGEKAKVIARNDEWAITKNGYIKLEFLEFVTVMEDDD